MKDFFTAVWRSILTISAGILLITVAALAAQGLIWLLGGVLKAAILLFVFIFVLLLLGHLKYKDK